MNKERVTAQEVKEMLEENSPLTKAQMAYSKECTTATIGNKLRVLRRDGEPIIHSDQGLTLLTKEMLKDPEVAETLDNYTKWMMGTFKGLINCIKPIKPLLPTLKRALKENFSPEERRALTKHHAGIVALLTYVEVDEGLE